MSLTQETVLTGGLRWAIRDSLLRYITVISRGTSELEGGVTLGDDGSFNFPLRSAVREGAEWHLAFEGTVHFMAHHGFLDINIINPGLIIGPEGGILTTEVAGDPENVIPLVSVTAKGPEQIENNLVWTDVETQLRPAGVGLFGDVYEAGTVMAPLQIRLSLD